METKVTTQSEFITKHGIQFECHPINNRPDGLMGEQSMFHYRCRIKQGRRGFSLYFSTGKGWTTKPTLADVLDCLANDASGYDNNPDFLDWAEDYGFDQNSRKAEKMFRSIKRQAEQLKRTLGEEAYTELLYDVERL